MKIALKNMTFTPIFNFTIPLVFMGYSLLLFNSLPKDILRDTSETRGFYYSTLFVIFYLYSGTKYLLRSASEVNIDNKNISIGKAGRSRWLGRRPHTRGVVKNPVDHPHGGGEGKSAGGRHPVSPTGQSAKGLKTRDNKRTDKFIVKRRNKRKDTK